MTLLCQSVCVRAAWGWGNGEREGLLIHSSSVHTPKFPVISRHKQEHLLCSHCRFFHQIILKTSNFSNSWHFWPRLNSLEACTVCVCPQRRLQLLLFGRLWSLERQRLTRLSSVTVRGVLGELSLPSLVAGQHLSEMHLAHVVQFAQS